MHKYLNGSPEYQIIYMKSKHLTKVALHSYLDKYKFKNSICNTYVNAY